RIPRTYRYRVTDPGLRQALFLARAHARLIRPGLAEIKSTASHASPLRRRLDAFTDAVHRYVDDVHLAA
ncbi:MAG TPA: hypothetical protein VGA16_10170, partial [Candidatus Limnocylindria bacterium]